MKLKKYIEFIKESSGYEYGCVMIEVPVSNWNELTNSIDSKDVYTGGDDSHGIQEYPHLTLLYGLEKGVTEDQVKSVIDNFKGEIKIEIDGINLFENEQFDVLKFNVVSDAGLQQLHDELSKLPNTDKFPIYKPHITIAYLNKGMGKKYVNPNYKYSVKNINKIVYSRPNSEKVIFDI
jgi:2'-5' RNA ligase